MRPFETFVPHRGYPQNYGHCLLIDYVTHLIFKGTQLAPELRITHVRLTGSPVGDVAETSIAGGCCNDGLVGMSRFMLYP